MLFVLFFYIYIVVSFGDDIQKSIATYHKFENVFIQTISVNTVFLLW